MWRIITTRVVGVMSLFLLLADIAHAQAEHTYTVVIVGSSTAEGYGINPLDSAWAYRLADHLKGNAVIKNLAKSGYSTYDVNPVVPPPANRPWPDTERNITKALSFMPDAIIINLPSNDAAAGFSLAEQQANFRLITNEAAQKNVPVWVTTTQPRTNNFGQPRENLYIMKEWLLNTYGEKAINFWEPFAAEDHTILQAYDLSDGIHVNIPAHRIMFEKVKAKSILDTMRKGPVNLIAASIEQLPAKQSLQWRTAGERFIDSFIVEQSGDSLNWTTVGRVKATGTTISAKDYVFIDDSRQAVCYYRIRAKDFLNRVFTLDGEKFVRAVSVYNLQDFSAMLQDNKVLLQWHTNEEKLTVRFYLESSTDKQNWAVVSEVPAKGNTTSASHYSYTDNGPLPLVIYYRLKMEDIDGQFTFSDDVRVITLITAVPGSPDSGARVFVYPNPAQGSIRIKGLSGNMHHVQIFDVAGRLMYEEKQYQGSAISVESWPGGNYFIVADKGRYRITFQKL